MNGLFRKHLWEDGKCNEVADLALFLISPKNSYMTGTVIYCDGGWTAK